MKIGFVGIGVMGTPMATNLLKSGKKLLVWNRTIERCEPLRSLGAEVAASPAEVFLSCELIITMLLNDEAMNSALARGTEDFARRVSGKIVVNMGTFAPSYSRDLAQEIERAGGKYVEAPVSGSRKPAEAGQLVAMLAGPNDLFPKLRDVLSPMCAEIVECGVVPSALLMKLAVNVYLITTVTGLAESLHFAKKNGLDPKVLRRVLDAGPMASNVSKMKLGKLVEDDFGVQASIVDVLKNNKLIFEAARASGVSSPLLDECYALYRQTLELGHGALDMVAVIKALEYRSAGHLKTA